MKFECFKCGDYVVRKRNNKIYQVVDIVGEDGCF